MLASGAKRFETRSWAVSYRGPIAIHAAVKKPSATDISGKSKAAAARALELYRGAGSGDPFGGLPLGCVLAVAELSGCYKMQPSQDPGAVSRLFIEGSWHEIDRDGDESLFGDFTPGRYA